MKRYTIILFALSLLSTSICSADELDDISKNTISPDLVERSPEDFVVLVHTFCRQVFLITAELIEDDSADSIGRRFESILLSCNGITRETNDYKKKIGVFFNKNRNYFICPEVTPHQRAQHIFTRVVDTSKSEEVSFNYLLHPSNTEFNIDINAVEIVDGKPETLLDYLQKIKLTDSFINDNRFSARVKSLERLIAKKHGAVLASELPQ